MSRSMFFRLCCRAPRISITDICSTLVYLLWAAPEPFRALATLACADEFLRHNAFGLVGGEGTAELYHLVAQQGGAFEFQRASGFAHLRFEIADDAVQLVSGQV